MSVKTLLARWFRTHIYPDIKATRFGRRVRRYHPRAAGGVGIHEQFFARSWRASDRMWDMSA